MKLAKVLTGLVFAGGTTIAAVGSLANIGVPAAEEPQGVSLRQESTRTRTPGFFAGYRAHRGGGLRGGK
jgi:hypothetical protein